MFGRMDRPSHLSGDWRMRDVQAQRILPSARDRLMVGFGRDPRRLSLLSVDSMPFGHKDS